MLLQLKKVSEKLFFTVVAPRKMRHPRKKLIIKKPRKFLFSKFRKMKIDF
jgi:hypothetical protein